MSELDKHLSPGLIGIPWSVTEKGQEFLIQATAGHGLYIQNEAKPLEVMDKKYTWVWIALDDPSKRIPITDIQKQVLELWTNSQHKEDGRIVYQINDKEFLMVPYEEDAQ